MEIQKGDQEIGQASESEKKVVNTLPELAAVSEIVNGDKGVKREVGAALNEGNDENIDNNIKNESEKKDKYSDNNKINIGGSVEKQVFELDDSDQIETISNTTLSLTGSKEKIAEDISLDNVSISKTIEKSNLDNEIVETIQIDETVIDTPFERTTFESISKIENYNNEPTVKSLVTDKITLQNIETNEITSTDTVITKKVVTEVSPDQTLNETITFKGNNDKVSKDMNVRSVEVKETFENDVKDQKNIESTTKQETTTETPVDKTTATLIVKDNSTINKVTDSDKKDFVITHIDSGDKSNIDVITATEIREEKPQLEDNDDEDLETPTPATPEGEEDLLITISKEAPELVPDVRDLKQVSDKLDPLKRSLNDLKLRKNFSTAETEPDIKSDKVEEEKLVFDFIKEAMIEGAKEETANQEVDQGEVYYSNDESGSPPKRIKIELNWDDIYGERKVLFSNSQIQTLIQPTTSSPSSIVADVVESMVTPGFNNNVVLAMNICFWLLFTALVFLAVLSDYNYMVLLNLAISISLYISLCWFIIVTRASQLEEANANIAKKED